MSSLSAARADNFYHPPEWDPRTDGSRKKFQKSKGSNQWEQKGLVRFEMPFNIWCTGCAEATEEEVKAGTAYSRGKEAHIGRGVRYDALKKHAGNYHSTKIFEFHMKCHMCFKPIVIRTDPKNCDYEIVSGARRKEEGFSAESAETIDLNQAEVKEKLATDTFYRMEHEQDDKAKAVSRNKTFEHLMDLQDSQWKVRGTRHSTKERTRTELFCGRMTTLPTRYSGEASAQRSSRQRRRSETCSRRGSSRPCCPGMRRTPLRRGRWPSGDWAPRLALPTPARARASASGSASRKRRQSSR
jgi:coiled-coil domain-containing protein 130